MQKNVLDINELTAVKSDPIGIVGGVFDAVGGAVGTLVDTATAIAGRNVALKLISATVADGNINFYHYINIYTSFISD
jgi:hypothetical protein